MLNWTDDDRPYVEALRALESVSRVLFAQEVPESAYRGFEVWRSLQVAITNIHLAWVTHRLARLRSDMAVRAR